MLAVVADVQHSLPIMARAAPAIPDMFGMVRPVIAEPLIGLGAEHYERRPSLSIESTPRSGTPSDVGGQPTEPAEPTKAVEATKKLNVNASPFSPHTEAIVIPPVSTILPPM